MAGCRHGVFEFWVQCKRRIRRVFAKSIFLFPGAAEVCGSQAAAGMWFVALMGWIWGFVSLSRDPERPAEKRIGTGSAHRSAALSAAKPRN